MKVSRLAWRPSVRLVPSRFPPVGLFDRVAKPEDLEVVLALEGLTNDRLRDEAGEIVLVPPAERIAGPGTTPIMAAFTHRNPEGSRFSDGSYGVYYAARDLETAVAETAFHRERFLARTHEAACEVDMRTYYADVVAEVIDLRGEGVPDLRHPGDYGPAQAFGRARREEGANGIAWDSVRRAGGECVAIFRPKCVQPCVQGPHVCYLWDGRRIAGWYEKRGLSPL